MTDDDKTEQSEPAALPDEIEGWKWLPKLNGYVLDLDVENNEWRRVYIGRRDHVIIEQQADDDNGMLGVPAAVLLALLREPAPNVSKALELLRKASVHVYNYADRDDVNAPTLFGAYDLLSEAITALTSGDTGGAT